MKNKDYIIGEIQDIQGLLNENQSEIIEKLGDIIKEIENYL